MRSTLTIDLYGAKGGVGTSVTAAALAIHLGGTLDSPDAAPILGEPGDATEVQIGDGPLVCDLGILTDENRPAMQDEAILVIAPCYIALRHAMACDLTGFRGVVVITEEGRALTPEDVGEVLSLPVLATIPRDPSIARVVDAGIMRSRLPRPMLAALRDLEPVAV